MVTHLHENINLVLKKYFKQNKKKNKLVVLDIGSNDATTLKAYPKNLSLLVMIRQRKSLLNIIQNI